jgi:hypothetical protein
MEKEDTRGKGRALRETAGKELANGADMVIINLFKSLTEVQGSLVGPPDFKSGVSSRGDGWVRFPCTSAKICKYQGAIVYGLFFIAWARRHFDCFFGGLAACPGQRNSQLT